MEDRGMEDQRRVQALKELRRQSEDWAQQQSAKADAEIAASKRRVQESIARNTHEINTKPKSTGSVADFGPEGKMQDMRQIKQWDDGRGQTLYAVNVIDSSIIQSMSERIGTQRASFGALSSEEQTRLRGEFDSSKGAAPATQPFGELLRSDQLGKRFQELKQNPQRPKI